MPPAQKPTSRPILGDEKISSLLDNAQMDRQKFNQSAEKEELNYETLRNNNR